MVYTLTRSSNRIMGPDGIRKRKVRLSSFRTPTVSMRTTHEVASVLPRYVVLNIARYMTVIKQSKEVVFEVYWIIPNVYQPEPFSNRKPTPTLCIANA